MTNFPRFCLHISKISSTFAAEITKRSDENLFSTIFKLTVMTFNDMKTTLHSMFMAFLCLLSTAAMMAQNEPADCRETSATNGWPSYYCDCKYNTQDFILPLDMEINDSTWFEAYLSEIADGLSAYLYSDCDMSFDVYIGCTAKSPKYQAVFEKNQTNTVNSQTIKEKLDEMGIGNMNQRFYICIAPVNGLGGRLVANALNVGFTSTCTDPLRLFPGMSMLSTATNDVYALDPSDLPYGEDIVLQWQGNDNAPCQLTVTRGECNGPVVAQQTINHKDDVLRLSAEQLDQAWELGEIFYLHFSHAANTSGSVCCRSAIYNENVIETVLCQGKGLQLADTLLTETTIYSSDTVHVADNIFAVQVYDLSFTAPEPQRDTIALRYAQLPYTYRGQYTIPEGGINQDYDVTIRNAGECDERYLLHVAHDLTTITSSKDTTICYGGKYVSNGITYIKDFTEILRKQLNPDTLIIDTIHVYFATSLDVINDTLRLKSNQLSSSYRYRGQRIKIPAFGDYEFDLYKPDGSGCMEKVLLHVAHNVEMRYETISETLCQGKTFTYNGVTYTSSTTFADTLQRDADTYVITSVLLTFTAPEAIPDTLALKQAELPYTYRGQETITTFGDYDLTIHTAGECDERYLLHVYHAIDTLYETVSETLCQGKVFTFNGKNYTTDTTFVDTIKQGADTYVITSVSITFTAPVAVYDTLALKSAQLPFTYRGQTISEFGDYDLTIRTAGECDERYLLHVYQLIDTLRQTIDETICQGKAFTYNGKDYTADTTFVDTIKQDADTYVITSVSLIFTAPEAVYDTLLLTLDQMPYDYRGQIISEFKDYDLTIRTAGECDERYLLHVAQMQVPVDTIYQEYNELICQGMVLNYNGQNYSSDVVFVDTIMHNANTCMIITFSLTFTEPEMEYDTVWVKTEQLLEGYYYEPTDTTIYAAGKYFFEIVAYNQCTRHITLVVNEEIISSLDNIPTTERPRLIMRDRVVYILRGKDRFTLLGEKW